MATPAETDTVLPTNSQDRNPASSPTARIILGYIRLLLRMFFSRIEVAGLENIPSQGGGVLVCWHPNGWIDGALIATTFPRSLVAAGRHGILEIPLLGWMMRQCGVLPVYRAQDAASDLADDERHAGNRATIEVLAHVVARGDFAIMFPEGLSHDDPFPHPLKTGAAYLYYRAAELTPTDAEPPNIVPVALHYNKKSIWGSQVLVTYHPPMALSTNLSRPTGSEEDRKSQAQGLTKEMERVLRDVVLATESWVLHHQLQRMRKLARAENNARRGVRSEPPSIAERVRHFSHAWRNYRIAKEQYPAETERLLADVAAYDWNLRALRIEDHELDGAGWNLSTRKTILVVLEFLAVWLLLPFFLVIGVLVNLPTFLLLQLLAKTVSAKDKDEASIKLLLGAVAFPVTWLAAAILVAWGGGVLAAGYPAIHYSPLLTGLVAFALSWFGAILVIHFRQIAHEARRTLGVRFTLSRRRQAVKQLLEQRASLYERLFEFEARLEPPRKTTSKP